MLLPSMKAVIPFICSLGFSPCGQKMSDLKVCCDCSACFCGYWSPGEWEAWFFSPLNFWKLIKVRVVLANFNIEASLQSRVFCWVVPFQDLMVTTFQLWEMLIQLLHMDGYSVKSWMAISVLGLIGKSSICLQYGALYNTSLCSLLHFPKNIKET